MSLKSARQFFYNGLKIIIFALGSASQAFAYNINTYSFQQSGWGLFPDLSNPEGTISGTFTANVPNVPTSILASDITDFNIQISFPYWSALLKMQPTLFSYDAVTNSSTSLTFNAKTLPGESASLNLCIGIAAALGSCGDFQGLPTITGSLNGHAVITGNLRAIFGETANFPVVTLLTSVPGPPPAPPSVPLPATFPLFLTAIAGLFPLLRKTRNRMVKD